MGQIITKLKKFKSKFRSNSNNRELDSNLFDRLISMDKYDSYYSQTNELNTFSEEENHSHLYLHIDTKIDDNFEKMCKYIDEKMEIVEDEVKEKIDNKFINHEEDIEQLINELKRIKEQVQSLIDENNYYKKLVEEDVSIYKSCYDTNNY